MTQGNIYFLLKNLNLKKCGLIENDRYILIFILNDNIGNL